MSQKALLKDVNDSTDRWSVVVRVFRKWNVYHKSNPTELFCISMLLIDEEGGKMQASVLNRSVQERFKQHVMEGKTYLFANFVVTPNVNQYRATNHPFKITFTPQTFVKEQPANIPAYSFSFYPIPKIMQADELHPVEFLIDVIGFIRNMGTLEEYRRDNETKSKLLMQLTDKDGHDVDCILFDECASDTFMAQLQNNDHPVVVVLNLARVGFDEDGKPMITSSFNATRVLFNPPTKEVKDFVESARDAGSPFMSELSQSMPSQSTQASGTSSLDKQKKVMISDIHQQKTGDYFTINCVIYKLETRFGWTYDGCSKCSTKVVDENGAVKCPNCKDKTESVEPKLKLNYIVKDDTGSVSVTFWDKNAVQLIGKTAKELLLLLPNEDGVFGVPKKLDDPVGKRMILKLKLTDYNKKYSSSSISVGQYTICEDLISQFMEASVEEEVVCEPAVNMSQGNRTPEQENIAALDKLTHTENCDEENITISELPQHVTPLPSKGKRRTYVKKNVVREESANSSKYPTSPSKEKAPKIIKQEK